MRSFSSSLQYDLKGGGFYMWHPSPCSLSVSCQLISAYSTSISILSSINSHLIISYLITSHQIFSLVIFIIQCVHPCNPPRRKQGKDKRKVRASTGNSNPLAQTYTHQTHGMICISFEWSWSWSWSCFVYYFTRDGCYIRRSTRMIKTGKDRQDEMA